VEAKVAQLEASALPPMTLLANGEDPTIESQLIESEEEEMLSEEELAEVFYADVAREIPWYGGPEKVKDTLETEGMRFDPGHTDELFQWLEEHASREANAQAEQEGFDWPEQERLPV